MERLGGFPGREVAADTILLLYEASLGFLGQKQRGDAVGSVYPGMSDRLTMTSRGAENGAESLVFH